MPSTPVLDLAVDRFELGQLTAPAAPVGQAWSNDVFRVETTTGMYAIKLYPSGMPTSQLSQLTAGMAFERSVLQAGSIPVPQPVAACDNWVIELHTRSGARFARCHHWVSGTAAALPLDPDLIRAAGRHLGVLHAMHVPGGDTSQLPPLHTARWTAAVRGAIRHRLGWANQLAQLTAMVDGLAADLEVLRQQRRPMRVSHRDYDPKNAVINTAGQLVITDWDYAGPVLPDVELVVAATSFTDTDEDLRSFVTAYVDAGGDAPNSDSLALTAEAADLDWLLRNVEACTTKADPGDTRQQYDIAAGLIASFPTDVATLRAWPDRFASLCR